MQHVIHSVVFDA